MSRKKRDPKAFAQQKRHRRQWLTFVRMCRYGVNNFSRNAWLTIAATAVMTITLLIIFTTFVAQSVLTDSVKSVSDKVDMSIYLQTSTTAKEVAKIKQDLNKLSNVKSVKIFSPTEARASFLEQNKQSDDAIEALKNATNQFPWTMRIGLNDINDVSELDKFVKNNKNVKEHLDTDREPSFAGPRRTAIQNLARWTDFAQRIGLIASTIFVAISSLIVFNTIRMAIFNRKEEINMMKLIGADSSFIRGPFVVEAIVYGIIAAVLATGFGIGLLMLSSQKLSDYGVAVGPTINTLTMYVPFVLLAMMFLGAFIGVVSSLLATRRYLKI